MKKNLIFILLIITCHSSFTQNVDSLWKVYNNKRYVDTNRLKAVDALVWNYIATNYPDSALTLAEEQLKLAQETNNKVFEVRAFNLIGLAYMAKRNYSDALEYYLKGLNVAEEINYKTGIQGACYAIGDIYRNQSNYPKALAYYLKSLKVMEEVGDKKGLGYCNNNIGTIYLNQKDYSKALEYYFKALQIMEDAGDKKIGAGNCYVNIGNVYADQHDFTKALEYYTKAIEVFDGDKEGIGRCLNNIGNIYRDQELPNYAKALECYLMSLRINKDIGDLHRVSVCYGSLGNLYNKLGDFDKVILYGDSAIQISKEIKDIDNERNIYNNLAIAYSKIGRYKEAYEYFTKYQTITDSIFSADKNKELNILVNNFEAEKRETEQAKLDAIVIEQKKRQQFVTYAVAGTLFIVLVFSVFLYRRFKITQKQKVVIEGQKKIVEQQKLLVDKAYEELHEKNKEVMDSIKYAKRIQTALITPERYIENAFNRLMKK